MNSRTRFIKALNHEETDKVPVDIGATAVTGISHYALQMLRQKLGLAEKPMKVYEPFQMLGLVEDDVIEALGIDVVGLWTPGTFFGYRNNGWKPWRTQQGLDVLVGEGFQTTTDDMGRTLIYPDGDLTAKPSGMMPKDGYYFDAIVRQEPYDEDHLDGRKDFREDFKIYNDSDLKYLSDNAKRRAEETEYGVILSFGGAGLGDAAFLPGTPLKKTPGIRNAEDWYMAHLLHPDYIKDIFEMQIEVAMENLKLLKEAVGDKAQAIFVSGTDFGTQRSEFISPDMFREFYKPHFTKVNKWIHENTVWKTFYHSCGSIPNLLDDFVDMGVDILNPVQCSAVGMEAESLKAKYGDRIVFWGGGADTQKTLPFGTPEEVRAETAERIRIFGKDGGFVFNPIHNIQENTPAANILAIFEEINGNKY
jgi:uroporphyrinogen-III decarboxylase